MCVCVQRAGRGCVRWCKNAAMLMFPHSEAHYSVRCRCPLPCPPQSPCQRGKKKPGAPSHASCHRHRNNARKCGAVHTLMSFISPFIIKLPRERPVESPKRGVVSLRPPCAGARRRKCVCLRRQSPNLQKKSRRLTLTPAAETPG